MTRDLRLFYLFRLLATTNLYVPIAVAFLDSRGLGFEDVMWLNTIWCATVLVFEVPTGALADRIGRRRTMMCGALVMLISCIVSFFAHSFPIFAISSALAGLAMTLTSGADSAYLYDLLADQGNSHEYLRREGFASAVHLVGQAVAFFCAGWAGRVNLGLPYLITGVLSLCAFAVAWMMREPRAPKELRPSIPRLALLTSYRQHIVSAFKEIAERRALIGTIGLSTLMFLLVRVTDFMFPHALDSYGFGIVTTGVVFAGVYLIAAATALRIDRIRALAEEHFLLLLLPAIFAVAFFALGLVQGRVALLFMALPAVCLGATSPLIKTKLNRAIPSSERRATILSVESMSRRIAFGSFSPLLGELVEQRGIRSGFWLCSAVALTGAGLYFALRSRRSRESTVPVSAATSVHVVAQVAANSVVQTAGQTTEPSVG